MPCVLFACAAVGTAEEQAAASLLIAKVFAEWEAGQLRVHPAAVPAAGPVGTSCPAVVERSGQVGLFGSGQPRAGEAGGSLPESFGVFTPRSEAGAWWHATGDEDGSAKQLPSVPLFPSWHEGDDESTDGGDGGSCRQGEGEPKVARLPACRLAEGGLGEDQVRQNRERDGQAGCPEVEGHYGSQDLGGHGHAGRAGEQVRLHREGDGQAGHHAVEEGPGGHGEVQQRMEGDGPDRGFVPCEDGDEQQQPQMQLQPPHRQLQSLQQVQHQRPRRVLQPGQVQQQQGQPPLHQPHCPFWRQQPCPEAPGADQLWFKAGRIAGKELHVDRGRQDREEGGQAVRHEHGREAREGHGEVQHRLGGDGPDRGSLPFEGGVEQQEPQLQLQPQHRQQQPLQQLQRQKPQLWLEPGQVQQQQGQPQPHQQPCPSWEHQQQLELQSQQQLCPVGALVAAEEAPAALEEAAASPQLEEADMAGRTAIFAEFVAWWEVAKQTALTPSNRAAFEAELERRRSQLPSDW
mmetsp:Transcript_54835/g.178161  ORF Transcript_54835/g.178161 Transcript_54835/m.178161 type:complete len:517 (-) Transcript_54835:26-1576(-)